MIGRGWIGSVANGDLENHTHEDTLSNGPLQVRDGRLQARHARLDVALGAEHYGRGQPGTDCDATRARLDLGELGVHGRDERGAIEVVGHEVTSSV